MDKLKAIRMTNLKSNFNLYKDEFLVINKRLLSPNLKNMFKSLRTSCLSLDPLTLQKHTHSYRRRKDLPNGTSLVPPVSNRTLISKKILYNL